MKDNLRFYRSGFVVAVALALPAAGAAQEYQGYANRMQHTLSSVVRTVGAESRASDTHIQTILDRLQASLQTETRADVDGEYRTLLGVYVNAQTRLAAYADRLDSIAPPVELAAMHTRLVRSVRDYAGYTGSLAELIESSLCRTQDDGAWSCRSDHPNGGMELLLGYIAMQETTFAALRRTHEQLRERLAEHLVTVPKLEASGS